MVTLSEGIISGERSTILLPLLSGTDKNNYEERPSVPPFHVQRESRGMDGYMDALGSTPVEKAGYLRTQVSVPGNGGVTRSPDSRSPVREGQDQFDGESRWIGVCDGRL